MIAMARFLAKVDEIDAEKPIYRADGDGSDGTCDCIGLIIGAIRRAGGKWTGSHGSNYAARSEVDRLRRIGSASDLRVGDVVFKAYNPGEIGWNLPAAYKNHPDQRDYYHVGVVRSVSSLDIVHCTTPTTLHDSKLGNWAYAARIKKVDEAANDEEASAMEALYKAVVTTEKDPLRVRESPVTGAIIGHVAKGKTVEVLEAGEWPKIRYNGLVGYVSGAYLRRVDEMNADAAEDGGADESGAAGEVCLPRELAVRLYAALGDALGAD